jgi:signal transduction histidine kinase
MCLVIDVTSAYICRYDPQRKVDRVLAEYIRDQATDGEKVSDLGLDYNEDSNGAFEHLQKVISGEFVVSHREDPDLSDFLRNHMHEFDVRSILFVPLNSKGRVVGYAELWESRRHREFTPREKTLCEALSHHAAIALENARLYERTKLEVAERQKAEAELKDERASLAERVDEQTAELRLANVELARAARLKDEFLASMSHELRTPLNAILTISEGLQEDLYGPLTEDKRRPIELVERSGRHLLELINDILDVSKIESGQLALNIEPVTVKSLCDASLLFVEESANKKGITIDSRIDNHVQKIQGDSLRLKQILINLLSNAVKFTPKNGTIGLEVQGDPAKQIAYFSVWDTGIGISNEDLPRLFEPFTQLDSKLSRRYKGTGLGLTLVKRMTEMHKGTVHVESSVGKGSRFTLTFPWQVTAQNGSPKAL